MGAFALIRNRAGRPHVSAAASPTVSVGESFQRQGYAEPRTIELPNWTIWLCKKQSGPTDNIWMRDRGNFCIATGTLIYRGGHGRQALQHYHSDLAAGAVDWTEVLGSFFLIASIDSQLSAHLDPLGTYKTYMSCDETFYSSSFLTVADQLGERSLDLQSVFEYVFDGATFGDRTVLREVRLFPTGIIRHFDGGADASIPVEITAGFDTSSSVRRHCETNIEGLRRYFRTLVEVFQDRIDTALSGGYDSRLILALLLDQGRLPGLHVYGSGGASDVTIATAIAAAEGLSLDTIDKSNVPTVPIEAFPALVERNFYRFDGYPIDGIFDNGADFATRLDRCAHGEVMLNGGGGEIFRNFFHLPNRDYTPREFLWSFHSRFDPQLCTSTFVEEAYYEQLTNALRKATGVFDRSMPRAVIEYLYPCFRCRFWMGRNNSLNNRFGSALTPFIDHTIVRNALRIPIAHKQYGAFEANLITELNPRLASYLSNYGHNFLEGVPLARRVKEWLTLARPPRLRRYTYRLQRRFLRQRSPPYYLDRNYIGALLDPNFQYMSNFFRVQEVNDWQHLNRICTLEYFCHIYRPRL